MDGYEKALYGTVLAIFTVIALMPIIFNAQQNAYHEYTGEVIAVEKNAWLWDHTTITMKTYSESTVTFSVNGFHNFDTGATLKIETKGGWWWMYPNLISVESS